jgi:hypothetical protein
MNWRYLTRRDIVGIIVVIVFLCAVLFASVVGPGISSKTNFGFSPEWDCVSPGKSEPVCIKRPVKTDKSN